MTETASTPPSWDKPGTKSNRETKESERDLWKLFGKYSAERESLTVEKRKGTADNNKIARLRDLEERLIPNVVRSIKEKSDAFRHAERGS